MISGTVVASIEKLSQRTGLPVSISSSRTHTKVILDGSRWLEPMALWPHLARALVLQAGLPGLSQIPALRLGTGGLVLAGTEHTISIATHEADTAIDDASWQRLATARGASASAVVIGGPSGAGKTTLVRHLLEFFGAGAYRLPIYTTRPRRQHEFDADEYVFSAQSVAEICANPIYSEPVVARGRLYWSRKLPL